MTDRYPLAVARSAMLAVLAVIVVASSSSAQSTPFERVSWVPPLADARLESALTFCARRGSCRTLIRIDPVRLRVHSVSPSGRYAVVWLSDDARGGEFHVFDFVRSRHATFANPNVSSMPSGDLVWTRSENILIQWSAGSYVAEAELYAPTGRRLLAASGSWFELSPDREVLVGFPPSDSPPMNSPTFRAYRMRDGSALPAPTLPRDWQFVEKLKWSRGGLHITTADIDGRVQTAHFSIRPGSTAN